MRTGNSGKKLLDTIDCLILISVRELELSINKLCIILDIKHISLKPHIDKLILTNVLSYKNGKLCKGKEFDRVYYVANLLHHSKFKKVDLRKRRE